MGSKFLKNLDAFTINTLDMMLKNDMLDMLLLSLI